MARVAIVTGAAQGIGRACADRLGREGYHVVAVDRAAEVLNVAAAELRAVGIALDTYTLDLADTAAARAMVAQVVATHGRVDALVNNAGYTERVSLSQMTTAVWQRMLDVHVRGNVFLTQAVARAMVRRGEPGAIVNISSIRAEVAEPGQVHYCAAKGALRTMTRAIAQELARYRIRVNAVAPGLTSTRMTADSRADPAAFRLRQIRIPLGRYAEADEIAAAVAYLLSDRAAFVTGATLVVDGGYLAG